MENQRQNLAVLRMGLSGLSLCLMSGFLSHFRGLGIGNEKRRKQDT